MMALRNAQIKLSVYHKSSAKQEDSSVSLAVEIKEAFRIREKFTAGELVEHTKKSPAGVRKALNLLVKRKVIRAFGSNRGRYYVTCS